MHFWITQTCSNQKLLGFPGTSCYGTHTRKLSDITAVSVDTAMIQHATRTASTTLRDGGNGGNQHKPWVSNCAQQCQQGRK